MQVNYRTISGNLVVLAGTIGLIDFFIVQGQTNIFKYLPIQLLHIVVGYSLLKKKSWAFNIALVFTFLNIISFAIFLPQTVSISGLSVVFYIRTGLAIVYSISVLLLWLEKVKVRSK